MEKSNRFKVIDLVYVAMFAVLIAICSWVSIPGPVPFTLQTLGVFLVCGILGGKRGTLSILVYLLLGMIGIPVFAGFGSGIATLLGPTGGYIVGFVLSGIIYWIFERFSNKKTYVMAIAMVLGLIVCYIFGTAWFMINYANNGKAITLLVALSNCVFPFIIPDLIKIALALFLSKRIAKAIKIN